MKVLESSDSPVKDTYPSANAEFDGILSSLLWHQGLNLSYKPWRSWSSTVFGSSVSAWVVIIRKQFGQSWKWLRLEFSAPTKGHSLTAYTYATVFGIAWAHLVEHFLEMCKRIMWYQPEERENVSHNNPNQGRYASVLQWKIQRALHSTPSFSTIRGILVSRWP